MVHEPVCILSTFYNYIGSISSVWNASRMKADTTFGPPVVMGEQDYLRTARTDITVCCEWLHITYTELRKLPPYSPLLNIVEQAISVLKAGIKADIFRTEIQSLMGDRDAARNRRISFGEFRTHLLDALHAAKYRYNNCSELREIWYRFMQTYIPRCLNWEAIQG